MPRATSSHVLPDVRRTDRRGSVKRLRTGKLYAGAAAAGAFMLLAGCSCYHKPYRTAKPERGVAPEVHFIEADDQGWFWNPEQGTEALQAVRDAAEAGDTVVVTFVHGWHHLAGCCDGNLAGFKEILVRLDGQLRRDMYRVARQEIHGAMAVGEVRVIGIYIGWRGRSLPGWLDYLTFWGRKSAAERVGEADFQEFMIRLRNLHEEHQRPRSAGEPPSRSNLFGMVTIGHSFGGQVVLRATSTYLEHKLARINDAPGYLRSATPPPPRPAPKEAPISGFGDLVVLVNPAVEAAAYQKLHALSRLAFPQEQWPLVLTLSAVNDGPRQRLFRWGRIAGEIFTGKPRVEARERNLERNSLGFASEQVTHVVKAVDADRVLVKQPLEQRPDPQCSECEKRTFDWYDWKDDGKAKHESDSLSADICAFPPASQPQNLAEAVASIQQHDFSGRTVFSDVVLDVKPGAPALPHQAFVVADVAPNVIDGHNGMFSRPLMDFLTTYIGFAEAKRLLPQLPRDAIPDPRSCYGQVK